MTDVEHSGTPGDFERHRDQDELGRTVSYYVSRRERDSAPLVLFVQGSGCHSVFRFDRDGKKIRGGYQNVLLRVTGGRARVMVVEKPGVRYGDDPGETGRAEGCAPAFLEEHTLPRWAAAIGAALTAARALPGIAQTKLLAVGHSEGGIVAARVAAEHPDISHLALLGSNGPTQLFDLVEEAAANTSSIDATPQRSPLSVVADTFAAICEDAESSTKFAWGHPFRRWSSFLATSTLDEVLRTRARIYLGHGALDPKVPVAAFDVLWAELVRRRRDVVAQRIDGANHSFAQTRDTGTDAMAAVFEAVLDWFLADVASL